MKQFLLATFVLFMVFNHTVAQKGYQVAIDLRKVQKDRLAVNIQTPKVMAESIAFHLPKIVPGTYAIHNYGAYVSNFKAYDRAGTLLQVEHPDANTWIIKGAQNLHHLSYEVDDSWDSPEIKGDIFEPAGTNIQQDSFFVLNSFGLIGYLKNLEERPYQVRISKPKGFYGATSLQPSKQSNPEMDVIQTRNYHTLVDAPILYCEPDTAWLKVGKTSVLIAVYKQGQKNIAKTLLKDIKPVLEAHRSYFGGKLPVDKYAFLVHFSNRKNLTRFGALEHSQSCFTFLPSNLPASEESSIFRDIAAHEFLHILTPLNIHSEEIGHFDYIDTKMSKHLWLYEGLTEYAAHHSQLRAGLIDLQTYLDRQASKINNATSMFNDSLAFTELSLGALDKYKSQYQNVYEKGALIGLCLDALLLQKSNGKYDTRALMSDLAKQYGPHKSFKDPELFDKIAELTYPEVRAFFKKHVENGEPLPLAETFATLGVTYNPKGETKMVQKQILFGMALGPDRKTLSVQSLDEATDLGKRIGFQVGDKFVSMNGLAFDMTSYQSCFEHYSTHSQLGDTVTFVVKRKISDTEEKELTLQADIREEIVPAILINPDPTASAQQLAIRSVWMGKK